MFGLRKSPSQVERIVSELGQCTDGIIDAARHDGIQVAMRGTAAVAVLIRTIYECHGVKLGGDTCFAQFMELVKRQDIPAITKEIRSYAELLERAPTDLGRGDLIYFWITGNCTGLR